MEVSYFKDKAVFLISPESWDYIFVSKHHYAIELAKRGSKVYFINPPIQNIQEPIEIEAAAAYPGVFIVNYRVSLRGVRFFPTFLMNLIERKFIKKVERMAGIKFDVVLNFENSRFYNFNFAGKDKLKIYFQVDQNQDFHPCMAAKTADICFAINDEILEIIRPFAKLLYKIPHAFKGAISEQAKAVLKDSFLYQRPSERLTAMYVGNIDNEYVDVDLIEVVIGSNEALLFRFVGPYDEKNEMFQRISKYRNVEFVGKQPTDSIPDLLAAADLLMLCYKENFTYSSHKLLEYFSSGKAIVSTLMHDFKEADGLICMSGLNREYPNVFRTATSNIEALNTPDRMQARIKYALDRTYQKRLESLEEKIMLLKGSTSDDRNSE